MVSFGTDQNLAGPDRFNSTHWSVVLAAGDSKSPEADGALEKLCSAYWYPLYAYLRRRGRSPHDAQDLIQSFFAYLLEKKYLSKADRRLGKFRSFLLASLNHFVADEWGREHAQKRGGGQTFVSIHEETAEGKYRLELVDELDPEAIYERSWATTLLEQVVGQLRKEFTSSGKDKLFDALQPFLLGDKSTSYAEAASQLNVSEGSLRVTVYRMRERFRVLFQAEIAHTVGTAAEIKDEVRHLFKVLG